MVYSAQKQKLIKKLDPILKKTDKLIREIRAEKNDNLNKNELKYLNGIEGSFNKLLGNINHYMKGEEF